MPARSLPGCAAAGLRVETDLRNEKINYKVREHSLAKVPYLLVVGKREAEERTVALRPLGADARQEVLRARRGARRAAGAGSAPPDLATCRRRARRASSVAPSHSRRKRRRLVRVFQFGARHTR